MRTHGHERTEPWMSTNQKEWWITGRIGSNGRVGRLCLRVCAIDLLSPE